MTETVYEEMNVESWNSAKSEIDRSLARRVEILCNLVAGSTNILCVNRVTEEGNVRTPGRDPEGIDRERIKRLVAEECRQHIIAAEEYVAERIDQLIVDLQSFLKADRAKYLPADCQEIDSNQPRW